MEDKELEARIALIERNLQLALDTCLACLQAIEKTSKLDDVLDERIKYLEGRKYN